MKNPALETLFYGLGQCGAPDVGRVLFVNAQAHADMPDGATCVQWFKPYADALAGHDVVSRIEDVSIDGGGAYDTAFILIPKNMTEARYLVARAFAVLKPEGVLY